MMKKQFVTALTLIAVSGVAWAGGSGKVSFQKLDTNRDGQISLNEAKKSPEVSKKFGQADANRDGKLDSSEFSALETMPESIPGGTQSAPN
jgi:EF hand